MAIETLTIADLKAKTTNTSDIYYTTDSGQEGEWYFDSVDTTSLDNEGTVIVSIGGLRFKRIFEKGIVNITWFGAKGDGINDDTSAIQAAIDYISNSAFDYIITDVTGGGIVIFPRGIFKISDTLLLGQNIRIQGVSKTCHDYNILNNNGGSVILCSFSDKNKWAISNATYFTVNEELVEYDKNVTAIQFDTELALCFGAVIDGIIIDGGDPLENILTFGGIRFAGSSNVVISNVGIYRTRIAIMFTGLYGGGVIENIFCSVHWYGVVITNSNSVNISSANLTRPIGANFDLLSSIPSFIYQEVFYSSWGLNDNVKYGKNGIYAFNVKSLLVEATVTEQFHNGYVILNCLAILNAAYIEGAMYYGLVAGVEKCQIIVNQILVANPNYCYYFGKDLVAEIAGHSSINGDLSTYLDILYVPDSTTGRNITFSKSIYKNRTYQKDISFVDEGAEGQNFGAVYVNPDSGNDLNYGFNAKDPVKTFDAALIRVQNQSTINPIKTIYIRAAPQGEGIDPSIGAATKELTIVSIENADLLITTYDTDLTVYPQRVKGRIYFKGDTSVDKIAMIGQVELLGNVNLYFRNIDLVCNTPFAMSSNPYNLSMFGLKNSYGRLTFNNESIVSPPYDIDLNLTYFLVQANLDSLILLSPKSLIDIKFVNISINGGALSPNQTGNQNLGVDCVQINSNRTGLSWQDAEIIRNNF